MVCLMVLPWVAIAVEDYTGEKVPCSECMASLITQVGPDDLVSLDGTVADVDIPDYLEAENIEYGWAVYEVKITTMDDPTPGTEICAYEPVAFTAIETGDLATFSFNAPTKPGYYMTVLTVSYTGTVTIDEQTLTLENDCIDWTCYVINVFDCAVCSDIFCAYDCADSFVTGTSAGTGNPCPDAVANNGGYDLCYPSRLGGTHGDDIIVSWFVAQTGTLKDDIDDTYLINDGDCLAANWCDLIGDDYSTTTAWDIWLAVYATADGTAKGDLLSSDYPCKVGTVVIVEEPIASISTS